MGDTKASHADSKGSHWAIARAATPHTNLPPPKKQKKTTHGLELKPDPGDLMRGAAGDGEGSRGPDSLSLVSHAAGTTVVQPRDAIVLPLLNRMGI